MTKSESKFDFKDWAVRIGPVHPLAFFRISLGGFLFLYWASSLMHASTLSTLEWLFFYTILTNLFLLTIGAKMRIAAGIIALVYSYEWWLLYASGTTTSGGITTELQSLFFFFVFLLLACSKADRGFSYAMHLRYGAWTEWEDVSILPQRLLAILITVSYIVIGYQKLWASVFRSGTVFRSTLIGPWGTALAAKIARAIPAYIFDWTIYILKAFGLMLPFCVWIQPVRRWFFFGGIVLHIAMALLLNIWWTLILIPGYLLFMEPEDVQNQWENKWMKLFKNNASSNNTTP